MYEDGVVDGPEGCIELDQLGLAKQMLLFSFICNHSLVNQYCPSQLRRDALAIETDRLAGTYLIYFLSILFIDLRAGDSGEPSEEPLHERIR